MKSYGVIVGAFLLLGLSNGAFAQVYKCVSSGKTVYQDVPCAGDLGKAGKNDSVPSVSKKGENSLGLKIRDMKGESCFDLGSNLAKVYLANFDQMASLNILSSDYMGDGCRKQVADSCVEGCRKQDCVSRCEIGFKQEAGGSLKGKR